MIKSNTSKAFKKFNKEGKRKPNHDQLRGSHRGGNRGRYRSNRGYHGSQKPKFQETYEIPIEPPKAIFKDK